jgi:hypothetical protein
MIQVHVFHGGESVGSENVHLLEEWTEDAVNFLLQGIYDDWKNNEDCSDMFESPTKIRDTLDVVSDNLMQGVYEAVDGGQVYVVRIGEAP